MKQRYLWQLRVCDCEISLTARFHFHARTQTSALTLLRLSFIFRFLIKQIFSDITFKYTHSLEQHTDFRWCPSMLLISLDYHCRVLHTRSFSSPFYVRSRPFTKVRTVTHCAVYLVIYMQVNYALCYSNTRASEISKTKTTKMVYKDRRQYHESKCLLAVVSQMYKRSAQIGLRRSRHSRG